MLYFQTWKVALILGICLLGVIVSFPNMFSEQTVASWPSFLPHKQVNLGLDLRGGSYLLLEVDNGAVERERLTGLVDELRTAMLAAKIGYTGLAVQGDHVSFALRDTARMNDINDAAQKIDPDLAVTTDNSGNVSVKPSEQSLIARRTSAVEQSIEIVRRRIDETGTKEPTIQREGDQRIVVELPGVDDPEHIKALLGRTAKMTFQLVDTTASPGAPPPPGDVVLQGETSRNQPAGSAPSYVVQRRVMVSGDTLTDSQPSFQNNEPVVSFKFDSVGARRFADATRANVGKPFAIVLDNKVISAPVIREAILGGSGVISGSFTVQSASDLALLLRAGALPAPLTILEERTVGPDLGADSIHAGALASIVGVVLVVVFMFMFYGLFGIFADIALFFNLCLMLASLTLLGATLTLPGIAGIALTMGMAVDANVLIYERIREEVRGGRSLISSLQAGFQRAFGTILDSHVTTLVAGALMFWLGSGPIKGFAVTLSIGVLTSLFSAILVTRLLIVTWLRQLRPKAIPIQESAMRPLIVIRRIPNIDFMRWHKLGFVFSGFLTIASILLFIFHGLNYGIDFSGGTIIEARSTSGPADLAAMRSALDGLGLGDVSLQNFGNAGDVLIRLQRQPGSDQAQEHAVETVKAKLGAGYDYRRTEVVGPTVGGELIRAGVIATVLALIAIAIYVWFRFEWQFGVGAMLSTLHDTITTIGLFSLFQIEFNLTTLAAILTIAGYSINDTVVIYDRVRETMRKYKTMDFSTLINKSLNETLSRTILTVSTVALAVLSLLIFGGEVLHGFSIAMLWGVVIGTYSSLFIAAPMLLYLKPQRSTASRRTAGTDEPVEPEKVS